MVRDNFVDAQKAADGILAGSSLPGFLTPESFSSFRLVLETVGMYEFPSLHLSWMAEELYSFTQGVAVYSSGAPGYVLVSVCLCPLVTLLLINSAIWMSSESSTNDLQREGSK